MPSAIPQFDRPETDGGDDMARHGISRVESFSYEIDGYRYARLADAVAQAKRGRASRGLES